MSNPPFGLRDYLAYGITGLLLALSVTFAVRGAVDVDFELNATQVVVALVLSYVGGHVLAELTAPFVMRLLTRKVGASVTLLMSDAPVAKQRLRSRYMGPLDATMRRQVRSAAQQCGLDVGDDASIAGLPAIAEAVVRDVHPTPERVARYRVLEDFCRNVSAAALACFAVLCAGGVVHRDGGLMGLAIGAIVVSVVMAARYLHFRHVYWRVVLVAFAAHVLQHGLPSATGQVRSATGRGGRRG